MSILSDDQVRQLLDASYDDDDMYIAIMLSAFMGLRRSELCALRWEDVILTDTGSYLSITKALVPDENGNYIIKQPKTPDGKRTLPIPSVVAAQLSRRRKPCPSLISISPSAISARYKKLSASLGIPCCFHDLRRYHASIMIREGLPEKYIIANMGLSSFDMVDDVHGHVMSEKQAELNKMMDSHASLVVG